MHRGERRLRVNTGLWCLILTLLVVIADSSVFDALAPMERWLYDRRCRYFQFFTPPPTDKLVHMDIDDAALDDVGAWPWPRSTMASLLDEIRLAGPKAVGLDILYTEPQEMRLVKNPDGTVRTIDDDAALAEAMSRLGNTVPGVSLHLNTQGPSKLYSAVRELLLGDLEVSEGEIITALAARGWAAGDKKLDEHVRDVFLKAREDAAQTRIDQELDAIQRGEPGTAATQPTAATRPAAAPPASRPSESVETSPEVLDRLYAKLLHRSGPFSPQGRVIVKAYEQVLARRQLRQFAVPIPLGLPPLAKADAALLPIPKLAHAARGVGFVEYPVYKDGVVRSVPLFMEYDGRMYPQMGLMLAALMLDADPHTFKFSEKAVVVPGKGNGGGDLVLPVRTHLPEGGGAALPLTFDIPWVGTSDWQKMLPQGHLSVVKAYDIRHTRQKIAGTTEEIDKAIEFLLNKADVEDPEKKSHKLDEFRARRLAPDDLDGRLALLPQVLKDYDDPNAISYIPPGTKPEKNDDAVTVRTIVSIDALRRATRDGPQLQRQLTSQRDALRAALHDRAVLIGWAATAAIADRKPTSIHPDAPGVVVHGSIFNAIMTGEMWRTLPKQVTLLVTLLVGVLTTIAVTVLPPGRAFAASLLLAIAFLAVNGLLLFDYGNIILGLAGPLVAIILVWAAGTMTRLIMESVERARITKRFASYVDPALVDFVLEHEDAEHFKGVEREMTAVFTDLAGFTALSERLGPHKIVQVLNEFMDRASRVIRKHGGYVNKFLGDGVMFFFNAPEMSHTHAPDAVATVLDLYADLEEMNVKLEADGLPPLSLRVGVTTGPMIVGDAGSRERCDYTILGDNVNLASRLESANKATGTANMITERTLELSGDRFLARPVGRLQVVGQTVGVMVYEVMAFADKATADQQRLADLTRAVVEASTEGRVADCLEAVVRLEEAFGESKLTHMYRDKCEGHLRDPSSAPFDRQIVLTQK